MKKSELREIIREELQRVLNEKWGGSPKVKRLHKYGSDEASLAKLKARRKALKKKATRSAKDSQELRRINFAIRARTGWGKVGEQKLGTGARFKKLAKKAAAGGARNPAAVAAAAGRKKYGKERFQKMAAAGRRRHAKG